MTPTEERCRVGYISASDPDELTYDFGGILPDFLQMECAVPTEPVRLVTPDAMATAESGLDAAARKLVEREVEGIVISIAPLVYLGGVGYDRMLIERLEATTALPVTTNQTAAVEAFESLGVTSIALLNPNTSDLLERQVQFFEHSGVSVDVAASMDIADNRDIDKVVPVTSYEFIMDALGGGAGPEGLYLSGPCWRTLELIEPLERELGIPVVTALQAMVWAAMRLVDRLTVVDGYGRLLARP